MTYFVFLIFSLVGTAFLLFLFYRFQFKAFYLLIGAAVALLLSLGLVELAGQTYAFIYPSYRILAFVPHKIVGWKLFPNLHFNWGGHSWYAREFSVPIAVNSRGFRDAERTVAKPQGVTRIALLGDSMVEAMQVPFEKTAGHLLEETLNAKARDSSGSYEVLNFGVSNYGVGQYLLTWEQDASKFAPDYVFILVGEIQMDRTVIAYESSAVSATERRLSIRPTFKVEKDRLVREPAGDYEEFVKAQSDLIEAEFGGQRVVRRHHELFIAPFLNFSLYHRLLELQRRLSGQFKAVEEADTQGYQPFDRAVVDVNLKVIEELGYQITERGGRLVIVDASRYFRFLKWQELSPVLKQFCADKGFAWIPLSDELLTAEKNGTVTRWPYDQHFNETGNKIFAEAMYRWILANVRETKAKASV